METTKIILILAIEFIVGMLAMPLAVRIAHRHGITDKPDTHLKAHAEEVPHIGGIVLVSLIALTMTPLLWNSTLILRKQIVEIALLLIIFGVGVIDDRISLPIIPRLFAQLFAAVVLLLNGNIFTPLPWQAANYLLTVAGIVICINAVNLIDIMDGLSGGVSIFAIIGLVFSYFYYQTNTFYTLLGLTAVVGLIVFLISNFRPTPRKVFLGDGGSTFLGLLLAILFLNAIHSRGEADTGAALIFISIPLFEVFFVSTMRILKRKNPLRGSNDHFPLRLRKITQSGRWVIVLIYTFAIIVLVSGIGVLLLPTVYKIICAILVVLLYSAVWIRLSRIKVD